MARIRTMAMGHWWRAYNSAAAHPKLGMLSDRQHRAWFNLMCMASENGGFLPQTSEIAYMLRMSLPETQDVIADLIKAKLFERFNAKIRPYNWDHRQFRSDSDPTAAERKRRQRQKEAVTRDVTDDVTVNVTRDVTPASRGPETETDTEAEKKEKKKGGSLRSPVALGEPVTADVTPKAEPAPARATRLASGWLPGPAGVAYAQNKGLSDEELNREIEKFANYWTAKSGQGATKRDWPATWRNWVITVIERRGARNGPGPKSTIERGRELAEEIRREERARGIERPDAAVRGR